MAPAETPQTKRKHTMKIKNLLAIGLALVVSVTNLLAAPQPYKVFSGSGTALSNNVDTCTYYVAPALTAVKGPAIVSFLSTHTDSGTGTMKYYWATNSYNLDATNATVSGAGGATNIPLLSVTNGASVVSNAVCVIRHVATETYERNRFYSGSTTNIIFQYPLTTTTQAGDIVYAEQLVAQLQVSTNAIPGAYNNFGPVGSGGGLASGNMLGNANAPFLMELTGTSISDQVKIGIVSGFYLNY